MVEPSSRREWTDAELKELGEILKNGLDIKDRKYRFKTYPSCFIGSDCVKFLIMNGVKYHLTLYSMQLLQMRQLSLDRSL